MSSTGSTRSSFDPSVDETNVSEGESRDDSKLKELDTKISEMEMMKERFSKLLLGEDMSGSGRGVSTALAISNAITNLSASVFGQLWRLEPLPLEKKSKWRKEMELLLCVTDYIVELTPCSKILQDGSKHEVMTCRLRSDLVINLPALCKLDHMLLEILDSFSSTEFWYVDQGIVAPEVNGSSSFRKCISRQDEKWWLPVPRVPPQGLHENCRKQLQIKRECATQILKAAMAINSDALAEMEVPESYLDSLPKNGKVCLGEVIYRYITSDDFSSECLLDCLDLSSEHVAVEIANRVEASIYAWRRQVHLNWSWEMVKELMVDVEKRELLAERAESLLLSLRYRFPCLTQTCLDTSKIQCNKDVGKSILESYSRVLESLAFNIVARIDDLLHVDELTRDPDHSKLSSDGGMSMMMGQRRVPIPHSVPASGTAWKTNLPHSLPQAAAPVISSPTRREITPLLRGNSTRTPWPGFGVKRVLTIFAERRK